MVPTLISQCLNNSGLYPKLKKVIFAKIAVSHEFPSPQGYKQEADIPQYQEQGRILSARVAWPGGRELASQQYQSAVGSSVAKAGHMSEGMVAQPK